MESAEPAAPKRRDYAKGTKTSIATSETQIKTMLQREGADAVAIVEGSGRALVAFQLRDRSIRFTVNLPRREDFARSQRGTGWQENSLKTVDNLWVQANRERWRQLHLCIKAKLEAVAQEIESFDEAFLAHVVMGDGRTVAESVIPEMVGQLAGAPARPLLPAPGAT